MRAASFVCFVVLALAACTQQSPPNVLFVTLDTTRADRLGPYGFDGANTPTLDALALRSSVYERAYSSSSWTLPSHASLFTGLLPMQHGAQTAPDGQSATLGYSVRPLADDFQTLAERLRRAGYRTAAVVAGPALKRELGLAQGFEHYDDDMSGRGDPIHGRRAQVVADRAIAQIESFGSDPWFVFVNFFDPHAPYRPPPPHDRDLPESDEARLTLAFVERLTRGEPPPDPGAAWERETLDAMLAGYDAEIRYMDRHLGRLLAVAEAARPNRLLGVVTADHGESFGEHDYVSHGAHLYEDNVRVPLLVQRPGQPSGERIAHPVANRAVFAAILDAAELPVPEGAPRLEAAPAEIITEVGASDANVRLFGTFFDRRLRAVYAEPHKLIESSRGAVELYDLDRDAGETTDLAASEPALRDALRERLATAARDRPPLFDPAARAELDPETREALRQLGYLE